MNLKNGLTLNEKRLKKKSNIMKIRKRKPKT